MGSSQGPTPLTTIQVKTPGEAIAFLEVVRNGCRQRKIEWWINLVLNTFASDAVRAAAAAHLARAISIDDLMEQNLITILQQAPMAQGIRLDMDEANETPAPAAEGTARPSHDGNQPQVRPAAGRHVQPQGHRNLGPRSREGGHRRSLATARHGIESRPPCTESIRTMQRIFAPINAQAASAARTALDRIFLDFTANDAPSTLVTKGLVTDQICKYYRPITDWQTHVVEEVTHTINKLHGPQHALTLAVTRCIEGQGFAEDPCKVELFQSTLITYETTYGVGISGGGVSDQGPLYVRAVAVARDQGRY
jgi:hypothetical protein